MPLIIRRCPICRFKTIRRKEVQTCGGIDCVATWKGMTSSEKQKAIESAEAFHETSKPTSKKELEDLAKWMYGDKAINTTDENTEKEKHSNTNTTIYREGDDSNNPNELPSKLADILGIKSIKEKKE